MLESFRGHPWLFVLGLIAGGGAVLLLGPAALWGILALSLAALLIVRFIAFQPPVPSVAQAAPADPLATLPPLTRLLLERLPMPVMLLDATQRILFVNQAMRAALGPSLERKHISAVLRNPEVLEAVLATQASGEPGGAPFTLPVPVERHYEAYTAPVEAGMLALLLHDVTAIRRTQQMRADFVANASHELRTPLAAVTGFIDTLRGHAKDDAVARAQFLDIMATEAARMRRLIDDLLSLTRIELNEHVKPEIPMALGPIVREASAALTPLAAQDRITVTITGDETVPDIAGDHDELVQLFQNLIHNAIKYGREGGHVTVTLACENGHVVTAIQDDGEGIPREALARLTERFYRVDVKRSRERGGTGLGLAIVKHIISRHRGRLVIDSKLGEGSIFTVFLPVHVPPPAPEKPAKTEGPAPVTEML